MTHVTRETAIELVRRRLAAEFGEDLQTSRGEQVVVLSEGVTEYPNAWVVPFNTKAYLEGGPPSTAMLPSAAVAPKDPKIPVHFPPTHQPTERYLEEVERGEGAWVMPPNETINYFARVSDNYPRENPRGISRRRIVQGRVVDENFTRNLRWEPTDYFERYRLGHNEVGHVRITTAEAHQYIRRITEKLSK